jgi:hypothetical protein
MMAKKWDLKVWMACLAALQQCTTGGTSWYQTFYFHNRGLEFSADFIVEGLEIKIVPTVGEAAHDGVTGGQSVFVGPVDIRGAEDCVAAAVEGNGDVLVATASLDGESSGVVGVELGKWEVHDVDLVSGGQCGGLVAGISVWCISGWCIRRGKWCKEV